MESPLRTSAAAANGGGADGDPYIASLTSSLALVPLAAVPAIIDCVLATSAIPPSRLFHSLLRSFPDPTAAFESSRLVSHASALCHLIKHPDAPADALRVFISRALVPLLEAFDPTDSELLIQIEGLVCDVVSKTQSWDLVGKSLVPICLQSLGAHIGIVRSEETDIYRWGSADSTQYMVLLLTACRILTSLLDCTLRACKECEISERFAANLTWDLAHLVLRLLSQATSTENRPRVIRLLLPSVFSSLNVLGSVRVLVHGSKSELSRVCFFKKIWSCCMAMFSVGHVERLDAYRVLSLYFSTYSTKGNEVSMGECQSIEVLNLMAQKEFWKEIRRGLVDKDAYIRKQALYILRVSLNHSFSSPDMCFDNSESIIVSKNEQNGTYYGASPFPVKTKKGRWAEEEAKSLGVGKVSHLVDHTLTGRERWKIFILLYEMLEEYGTHLVEAAWTHQVSLLFQSMPLDIYRNPCTSGVYQVQMETIEGILSWLAVLCERGFFHGNPQVRCLIMESFLGIDWDKYGYCAHKVPRPFVLGPLMLGLNDPVHHKDFGIKGAYTSKTIECATRYFCEVSSRLSLSERITFVWSLASVARDEAFGRAGLMTLAFCIASSACSYNPDNAGEVQACSLSGEHVDSAHGTISVYSTSDLLDGLGIIVEKSKHHFNQNYRLEVCVQVVKAVSSLISICNVPFDLLLHFISIVPREFTDLPCPLRERVQQWLTHVNNRCYTYDSLESKTCVFTSLINFPMSFIKHEYSDDVPVQFDDEDLAAWEVGAKRWARMLFLVITEEKHLEPIFMFLLNHTHSFCHSLSIKDWIPLKLLILILSLIEELQLGWKKPIRSTKAKACIEFEGAKILDKFSCPVTSISRERIIKPFVPILEDLVSFAKLVSPILLSTTMQMDSHSPCFVSGKLGGPSQRRLSPDTTSAVLQAIFSIKAVACASSWCAELKTVDCLDPCFTFLWDFAWKVIQCPVHKSESRLEQKFI